MKYFYHPAYCSLAPHIIMKELGLEAEMIPVNLENHTLPDGSNYRDINPNGYVPALMTNEGEIITEGSVILQYLANLKPEQDMGALSYKDQSLLAFVSSELHKRFGSLFGASNFSEDGLAFTHQKLQSQFEYLNGILKNQEYLTGGSFGVIDAYVFTVMNWRNMLSVDISNHAELDAYLKRIAERESVVAAMTAEGLLG